MAAEIGRPRLEGPISSTGMIRYGKEVKAPGGFARGPGMELARLTRPLATSYLSVRPQISNRSIFSALVSQSDDLQLDIVIY